METRKGTEDARLAIQQRRIEYWLRRIRPYSRFLLSGNPFSFVYGRICRIYYTIGIFFATLDTIHNRQYPFIQQVIAILAPFCSVFIHPPGWPKQSEHNNRQSGIWQCVSKLRHSDLSTLAFCVATSWRIESNGHTAHNMSQSGRICIKYIKPKNRFLLMKESMDMKWEHRLYVKDCFYSILLKY